jgi:hypothetical protein
MNPFDDDFEDAVGTDPPDPAQALELLDSLVNMVIAKVNGDMNYRGNAARYTHVRRQLEAQLRGLGVRRTIPWHTLDEGVAALRVQASASGSHRARRDRATEVTEPLRAQLRRRLDDDPAGDVNRAAAGLGASAMTSWPTRRPSGRSWHASSGRSTSTRVKPSAGLRTSSSRRRRRYWTPEASHSPTTTRRQR